MMMVVMVEQGCDAENCGDGGKNNVGGTMVTYEGLVKMMTCQ